MVANEKPGANLSRVFIPFLFVIWLLHVFQLAKAVRKQRG